MYLTYDEYINMGGAEIEETTFQQLEFEARAVIDWWTFNRLKNETSFPEAVKRCMLKIIQLMKAKQDVMVTSPRDSNGNVVAGLSSESNDGVSASYNILSAKDMIDTSDKAMANCIRMYLTGVKNSLGHRLLYRGLYPNE